MNDHPDNKKLIRRAALNLLARRDYTEHEIKRKLIFKGYTSTDVEMVVADLIQAGLVNNIRFAENYIYSRRRKGYGPIRISVELQNSGVSEDVIAELIKITDNAWFSEIRKVWQKYFKGKLPIDYKDRAKQMRFLQYRGFTREQIDTVLTTQDEEVCQ